MNEIRTKIELDLYDPTTYKTIKAQQGDNNSRTIEFELYNQGEPYQIPDNILVMFEGHRGDNSSFTGRECCVLNNIITITLDKDILYASGIVEAKIVMIDLTTTENKILSTIPFKIFVQKNPCDKNLTPKDKSVVTDLIIKMERFSNSASEIIEQAKNSADVAKEKANEALNSASDAVQSSIKSETHMNNAQSYAEEINNVKTEILEKVTQVDTKAESASNSASRAESAVNRIIRSQMQYGVCHDSSNPTKTVFIENFLLDVGAKITVMFVNDDASSDDLDISLNVSSTGPKKIYYHNLPLNHGLICGGCVYSFVYDGVHWIMEGMTQSIDGGALWKGALYIGGTITFDVPERYICDNHLDLMLDSFINDKSTARTVLITLFFGRAYKDNDVGYWPYNVYEIGNSPAIHILKRDVIAGSIDDSLLWEIICIRTPVSHGGYNYHVEVINRISGSYDDSEPILTRISAYTPK